MLAAIVLFAVLITCIVFIRQLDGPSSFVQEYDNSFHLNLIRSFVDSGEYSVTHCSTYLENLDAAPVSGVGYYPAGWHCVAALLVSALGVSPALATNALNSVIVSVVYPVSMFYFLGSIWGRSRRMFLFAPILIVAFQAFPWRLLDFGPLYSNLFSLALAPLFLAAFIVLCADETSARARMLSGISAFIILIDLVVLQPNSVFTCGVILIPYCVSRLWSAPFCNVFNRKAQIVRCVVTVAFLLFAAVVWTLLYRAPALKSVVEFSWASFASKHQALINILAGAISSEYAQIVVAALILSGVFYALHTKKCRWLIWSYALVAFQYYICATDDGFLKHFLTGFWYTDSYRIAASLVLVAVPLACMGAYALCMLCYRLLSSVMRLQRKPMIMLAAVFLLAAIFIPNYSLSGQNYSTAFGMLEDKIATANSTSADNVLNGKERDFLEKVQEAVPEDALILNQPFDGSVFAYALYDLNVYYSSFGVNQSLDETEDSKLLRLAVDDWQSNAEVSQALKDTGIKYVLLLDEGENASEQRRYLPTPVNEPGAYGGIEAIGNENAPGFTEILRDGDMVLYEILN